MIRLSSFISLVEFLYAAGCIHKPLRSGKKRMRNVWDFNLHQRIFISVFPNYGSVRFDRYSGWIPFFIFVLFLTIWIRGKWRAFARPDRISWTQAVEGYWPCFLSCNNNVRILYFSVLSCLVFLLPWSYSPPLIPVKPSRLSPAFLSQPCRSPFCWSS